MWVLGSQDSVPTMFPFHTEMHLNLIPIHPLNLPRVHCSLTPGPLPPSRQPSHTLPLLSAPFFPSLCQPGDLVSHLCPVYCPPALRTRAHEALSGSVTAPRSGPPQAARCPLAAPTGAPPRACDGASLKLTVGQTETKTEAMQALAWHLGLGFFPGRLAPLFEFPASPAPPAWPRHEDTVAAARTGEVGSLSCRLQVGKLSPTRSDPAGRPHPVQPALASCPSPSWRTACDALAVTKPRSSVPPQSRHVLHALTPPTV